MSLKTWHRCAVYLLLSLAAISRGTTTCPGDCTCSEESVTCTTIPQSPPHNDANQSLIIKGANITRIWASAFSNFPQLQRLELNQDIIETLADGAFQELAALESLALNRNYLQELSNQTFRGLGKLKRLELSYNKFVELGEDWFGPLKDLKVLDLARNNINILHARSFSGLGSLNVLNLMNNNVMMVSGQYFAPLKALNILIMDENDIEVINNGSFSSLVALRRLTLTGNRLLRSVQDEAFVPDSGSGSRSFPLEELSLKGTELREVPVRTLSTLPELKNLDLSLTSISTVKKNSFSRQKNLVNLTIDYLGNLRTIESGAFLGLTSLQRLVISNNRNLSNIGAAVFRKLSSLKHLDLHNNGIETLRSGLADWNSIEVVDLRGNPIRCDCHASWILTLLRLDSYNTSAPPGKFSAATGTKDNNDNVRNDVCSNVSSSKPPAEVSTTYFTRHIVCHMPPRLHKKCLAALRPEEFCCATTAEPKKKDDTDQRLKVGIIAASVACFFLVSCALFLKFRRRICSVCKRQYRYKAYRNRGMNGGSPSAEIVELEVTQLEDFDSDIDTKIKL
ncbi:carboxypeptidase N subunit 2-like [Littorina saxatilis]|uniref:LRRCT domain-containing protein n=1 Tax=Littorina saxatilis TaxID=31220 RepID=A0AAN9ALD4_9CAEN